MSGADLGDVGAMPVPVVSPEQRARAVRVVCGLAEDAASAARMLEMLGLDPAEGRRALRGESAA